MTLEDSTPSETKKPVVKNKSLAKQDMPGWAVKLQPEERVRYLQSPQCKVCNCRDVNGRRLRYEIESMFMDGKSKVEICNAMYDRYAVRILPDSVRRHMERHAPIYTIAVSEMMNYEIGEVLARMKGRIVEPVVFMLAVVQVGMQNLLEHPEQADVTVALRAAKEFCTVTEHMNINVTGSISQEDINKLLDIMQMVMTPEQRVEVRRRFNVLVEESERSEEVEEAEDSQEMVMIEVDGEMVNVDDIPTLPNEELGSDE